MIGFEKELIEPGFTAKELCYLKKNIDRYGSSLQSVVMSLAIISGLLWASHLGLRGSLLL